MARFDPAFQPAPLTNKRSMRRLIITLSIIGVIIAVLAGFGIAHRLSTDAIVRDGIQTDATSTGSSIQSRQGGRRTSTTGYKTQYSYVVADRTYFVYGAKLYETPELAGQERTVQVKYLATDPTEAVVVSGE